VFQLLDEKSSSIDDLQTTLGTRQPAQGKRADHGLDQGTILTTGIQLNNL
jgi:hypothetical protein